MITGTYGKAVDLHSDLPQVVVGAGFSGHGFEFASVIGEILADLTVDGSTRHDIGLLRLDGLRRQVPPAAR